MYCVLHSVEYIELNRYKYSVPDFASRERFGYQFHQIGRQDFPPCCSSSFRLLERSL